MAVDFGFQCLQRQLNRAHAPETILQSVVLSLQDGSRQLLDYYIS